MNNLQWFIIFCCNIHISDPPTCRTRTQVLYTVAINTSVELECSMVANPQHDIIFRHQCIFLIYQQFKFWKRFWNLYKKNRSLCFFSNPFPQYFRNPTMSYYRVSPKKEQKDFWDTLWINKIYRGVFRWSGNTTVMTRRIDRVTSSRILYSPTQDTHYGSLYCHGDTVIGSGAPCVYIILPPGLENSDQPLSACHPVNITHTSFQVRKFPRTFWLLSSVTQSLMRNL